MRSKAREGSPLEKKLRDSDKEIVKRVEEIAKQHSWTMAQVALSWSSHKATSPIGGLNSVCASIYLILAVVELFVGRSCL